MDDDETLQQAYAEAACRARRRVRRLGHVGGRSGRGRVPGLPHLDRVGGVDPRRPADDARPQPAGARHHRDVGTHGRVPAPRRAAAARAGVTDAEIDELLFQLVAYAGGPAGVVGPSRDPRSCVPSGMEADVGTVGFTTGFVGLGNMGSALAANLVGAGTHRRRPRCGRRRARARWRHARRHRRRRGARGHRRRVQPARWRRVGSGGRRSSWPPTTGSRPTSSTRRPSGVAAARRHRRGARRSGDRLRRRTGVGRRRRRPRPHARGDVLGVRRRLRRCRGGARRPQRLSAPRRRSARPRAGDEARQQLPLGHRPGRHQRGGRLRRGRGARHGHHARGAQRLERSQRRLERQVPQPRPHRSLRIGVQQLADGQGRAAVPRVRSPTRRGPPRVGAVTAAVWQRSPHARPGVDFTRIYPFVATSFDRSKVEER